MLPVSTFAVEHWSPCCIYNAVHATGIGFHSTLSSFKWALYSSYAMSIGSSTAKCEVYARLEKKKVICVFSLEG